MFPQVIYPGFGQTLEREVWPGIIFFIKLISTESKETLYAEFSN